MDSDSDAYMHDAMSESEDDFMASDDDSPVKVVAPKKKGTVLASKENTLNAAPAPSTDKGKAKKTVEQIYQKKTQLEHILLRPDTYSK